MQTQATRRIFNSKRQLSLAVTFKEFGNPYDVLKLGKHDAPTHLEESEVSLRFLAAPINPSDFNMVQGVYGVKPKLPAIAGNEGVAKVERVGGKVKNLQVGDWVIPRSSGFGTWRQNAIAKEVDLVKIPNDIPVAYAATISVNPCTAYRLLRDFEKLEPGDVIIQNGANSMVGLAVVQMAREMGLKTINVVRSDRPDLIIEHRLLHNLGGDVNITDCYLNSPYFHEVAKELPPIKLALNCVGGDTATAMAQVLAPNGTMVTYGGMSKRPLTIPTDLLTYKQLKLKGFWMSKWSEVNSNEARLDMLQDIAKMIKDQKLTFFLELHDFDDFVYALETAEESFNFRKVVLNLDYPDRMVEHDKKTTEDYWMFEAPAF